MSGNGGKSDICHMTREDIAVQFHCFEGVDIDLMNFEVLDDKQPIFEVIKAERIDMILEIDLSSGKVVIV